MLLGWNIATVQCCLPEGVEIVLAPDIKEDAKPKLYPIVLTGEWIAG